MSPERLLKHFEQISEAPDAVPRLRRFVLDLAVRGKIVEQDPNDEPAADLLKRIAALKVRLMKAGLFRKQPQLPPLKEVEVPFEIPASWKWVRLIELLTKLTDGTHHSPPNFGRGDYKYITAKNIKPNGVLLDDISFVTKEVHNEIYNRCDPEKGDILYIKDGATTGIATVNDLDEPFSMLSSVALLKVPEGVYNRLLVFFLRSPFFYQQMRGFMKGAAITRVTLKRMAPALIPLPPLAEQQRIVAKVDELMALCDKLEAAQAKREKRRDRVVTATLHGLNNGDASPEPGIRPTFKDSARFYLNHLPRLTTRPEHIHQLRQTILNLAVHGKLVKQNPSDEPAPEFLKKIEKEKGRLIKIGRARKTHPFQKTNNSESPFELPEKWEWVSLMDLGITQTGNTPSKNNPEYFGTYIPFVKPADLTGVEINYDGEGLSQEGLAYARLIPKGSALMVCIGSSIGKVNRTTRDICCNQQINTITPFVAESGGFIALSLKASFFQRMVLDQAGTGTLPIISKGKWEKLPVPLPPLSEQYQIVAKVDELMALCDKLESWLTSHSVARYQLLQSVLQEAIGGRA